jgi:hypothetical protein
VSEKNPPIEHRGGKQKKHYGFNSESGHCVFGVIIVTHRRFGNAPGLSESLAQQWAQRR